jgi:hypothetical protein
MAFSKLIMPKSLVNERQVGSFILRTKLQRYLCLRLVGGVVEIGSDKLDGDLEIEKRLSPHVDDAHDAVSEDFGHVEVGLPSRQPR